MQDPTDSRQIVEPDTSDEDGSVLSPGPEDESTESDGTAEGSVVLTEVLPGIAVVSGNIPEPLRQDLVGFGLVPPAHRAQLSASLAAAVGGSATVGGNLVHAFNSAQGLYRVNAATQALLNNGAVLALKDGANLGAVFQNGKIIAQARFVPASVTAAQTAATVGPALAMIAIQMQLSEISGLVRTNIALTQQVLTAIRHEQWAELTGLVATIDRAFDQAQEIGSVPSSLWDTVAGRESALRKQLDLYRRNVATHVRQIDRLDTRARREYLDSNAEAILFDSNALLSSLKAWTAFQALHASKASESGATSSDHALLVDIISRDTQHEFGVAMAEATRLIDALARELRLVAQLPGRATLPLSRKRKDTKGSRFTSGELLRAIEPLADALLPPRPPLDTPAVVCGLTELDLAPYLRVLRWYLDSDEVLRCIAFPYQLDEGDVIRNVGSNVFGRLASEKWATFVAVTDRRIITGGATAVRRQGEVREDIPVEQVRYVRMTPAQTDGVRSTIDLITRDMDLRWAFRADTDGSQVGALAGVLAEGMAIPDDERAELLQLRSTHSAAETSAKPLSAPPTDPHEAAGAHTAAEFHPTRHGRPGA